MSNTTFPYKLYQLLETLGSLGTSLSADESAAAASIAWLPHGRAFIIRDQAVFASKVLPVHFENIKYRSFLRQLNLWGFQRTCQHCVPYGRIHMGPDLGGWYHHHFLRGKGVDGGKAEVEMAPQFYDMPPIEVDTPIVPNWFFENRTSLGERGAASFPARENVFNHKGPGNNDNGKIVHHATNQIDGQSHQGFNTYYGRSLSSSSMDSLQMASPFATQPSQFLKPRPTSAPNLAAVNPSFATRRLSWHAGTYSELKDTSDSNLNLCQVEEMESHLNDLEPLENEEYKESDSSRALWSPSILSDLIGTLNDIDPIELTQNVPAPEPDDEAQH
ncbi:hypothetical protein ACHAWO_006953 [Cyclotella atomus]|uniref:HSF-type DNA-binding domain-containing protein n=1 Tax=Cyclotella atomus TaxID=382360 RepID=A0ABD3Q5U6_9STRA